jgi:hypothetical protein
MDEAIAVLRITEPAASVSCYGRLRYEMEWERRFEQGFTVFVSIARNGGGARLFLSEHTGDATPGGLVYLRIGDLEAIAHEFGSEIIEQPWGRDIHLVDPDGNRLRIGDTAPNE